MIDVKTITKITCCRCFSSSNPSAKKAVSAAQEECSAFLAELAQPRILGLSTAMAGQFEFAITLVVEFEIYE